ncbi:signal peptidase I [Candidatus Gottesmanbacteria bacterium]|nr:signal peptidase I [Candidatus Gottesmanbacteria bacterium]
MPSKFQSKARISPTTITIITIVLLVLGIIWNLLFIIGIIIMWRFTFWPKWLKILLTLPLALLLALSFGVVTYLFFIKPIQIKGIAMNPSYKDGQYYVAKVVYSSDTINRYDVVVFQAPDNKDIDYFKRVIGLPGEKVMIQGGQVYINGKKLDDSKYLPPNITTMGGTFLPEDNEVTIPSGHYFVLGDNRPNSADSRFIGFIPRESITGKITFCYWNCN